MSDFTAQTDLHDHDEASSSGRWNALRSPGVWLLIGLCVEVAGLITTGYQKFPPFLVGPVVILPEHILDTIFAVGGVCWLIAAVMAMRNSISPNGPELDGAPAIFLKTLAAIVMIPVGIVVFLTVLGLNINLSSFHVVAPTSPSGCRVVVETSTDTEPIQSVGLVYLAPPESSVLKFVAYAGIPAPITNQDDQQVTPDQWSLTWSGSQGVLTGLGQDTPITCPA